MRNFSSEFTLLDIHLKQDATSINMKTNLAYKESFFAIGNIYINDLHLVFASCPILFRANFDGQPDVWFIQNNNEGSGQMIFEGRGMVAGNLSEKLEIVNTGNTIYSILWFGAHSGSCKVSSETDFGKPLYIVCLDGDDLYTINPMFEESWFEPSSDTLKSVVWGCHGSSLIQGDHLQLEYLESDKLVFCLKPECPEGFQSINSYAGNLQSMVQKFEGVPSLWLREATFKETAGHVVQFSTRYDQRVVDFGSFIWHPLPCDSGSYVDIKSVMDPLDFGFTSGQ